MNENIIVCGARKRIHAQPREAPRPTGHITTERIGAAENCQDWHGEGASFGIGKDEVVHAEQR